MGVITIPAGGMDQRAATCNGQPRIEYTENLRLTGDGELARSPGYARTSVSNLVALVDDGTGVDAASPGSTSMSRTSLPLVYTETGVGTSKQPLVVNYGQQRFGLVSWGSSSVPTAQTDVPNSHQGVDGIYWATHVHSTGTWQVSGDGSSTTYTLWKNGVAQGTITGVAMTTSTPHYMLSCCVNTAGTRICVGYSSYTIGAASFVVYDTSTGAVVHSLTTTTERPVHHDCRYDSSGYWVAAFSGGLPANGNVRLETFNASTGARTGSTYYGTGVTTYDYQYGGGAVGCYLSRDPSSNGRYLSTTACFSGRRMSALLAAYTLTSGVPAIATTGDYPQLDGWMAAGSPVMGQLFDEWFLPVTTAASEARMDGVAFIRTGQHCSIIGHWNDGLAIPAQSRNVRLAYVYGGTLTYYGTRMQRAGAARGAVDPLGASVAAGWTVRFCAAREPYMVKGVLQTAAGNKPGGMLVPGGTPFFLGHGAVLRQDNVPPMLTVTQATDATNGWIGSFQVAACTEVRTPFGIVRGPVGFTSFTNTTALKPTLVLQSGYPRFWDTFGAGSQMELKVYVSVNGGPFLQMLGGRAESTWFATGATVSLPGADATTHLPRLDTSGPRLYSSGASAIGGVLPSYAPPSCTAAWEGDDRFAVCGLVDYPNDVFFSKLRVTGEAPAFANVTNTQFHVTLPAPVVGVAKLATCWVAWTETGTFAIYGDGPDDTGNNGSWELPRQVSSIGLMTSESIVTDGSSVYWQAMNGGIFQMGADMRPVEISSLVRDLLNHDASYDPYPSKVLGATFSPTSGLVEFLVNDPRALGARRVLHWNPSAQAWGCDTISSYDAPDNLYRIRSSAGTWYTIGTSDVRWVYECAGGETPSVAPTFTVRTNDMPLFGIGQEGQFTRASVAMFRQPLVTPLASDMGTTAAAVTVSLKYNGAPVVADASDTVTVTPEAFAQQWADRSTIPANESAFVEVSPRLQSDIRSVRVELTWDATVAAFSSLQLEGVGFQNTWRTGSSSRG